MVRNSAPMVCGAALVLFGCLGGGGAMAAAAPRLKMTHPPARGFSHFMPRLKPPRPEPPPVGTTSVDQPGAGQRFHGLLAADQAEVRSRIGAPDVARGEGAGAMWTYRLPDCALFVFFRAAKGGQPDQAVRVSGAASGPRTRGRPPLPVNDCIAQAMSRQSAAAPAG